MRRAGKEFETFEFAGALQVIEDFFWSDLCDNYLELVKVRAYSTESTPGKRSALATLKIALSVQLRLFAPYLPFITEEVWNWLFATSLGREQSIHTASWPKIEELADVALPEEEDPYGAAVKVLFEVRDKKRSQSERENSAGNLQYAQRRHTTKPYCWGGGRDWRRRGTAPPVVFVFPGQGSRSDAGMGEALDRTAPVFRAALDACGALLARHGIALREVLWGPDAAAALTHTALAQPALVALEYAVAQQWMAWGVRPAAVVGHSVGELTAAIVSGALSIEERADARRATRRADADADARCRNGGGGGIGGRHHGGGCDARRSRLPR